jgi:hypothetical protein
MVGHTVQVERWDDTGWAFLRVRDGDAPEMTDVIRCIDYNLFRETPIPAEHRVRAGALTALLFGYSQRTVLQIELRWFEGVGVWVADALIDDGDQTVYRRGTAATPVDALTALAVDIQDY